LSKGALSRRIRRVFVAASCETCYERNMSCEDMYRWTVRHHRATGHVVLVQAEYALYVGDKTGE